MTLHDEQQKLAQLRRRLFETEAATKSTRQQIDALLVDGIYRPNPDEKQLYLLAEAIARQEKVVEQSRLDQRRQDADGQVHELRQAQTKVKQLGTQLLDAIKDERKVWSKFPGLWACFGCQIEDRIAHWLKKGTQ